MKKGIINIVKAAVFIFFIIAIYSVIKFGLVDDAESLTRITLHDLYTMDENIDTLFIGSSHVFRGVNSAELSNITDRSCFSLSCSAQDVAGSYFLLLEADKINDIKDVYLEVSPVALSSESINETKTYIITDYMKPSLNKYRFLFEVISPESYTNAFFTVCRYTNTLENDVTLKKWYKTAAKKDDSYFNYSYRGDDTIRYEGRGHWSTPDKVTDKGVKIQSSSTDIMANPGVFNEDEIGYLTKIAEYCEKNQMKLHILVMPYMDLYVACQPDAYNLFYQFLSDFAAQHNIPLTDFNAVPKEDLQLTDECFKDKDHLNKDGSMVFLQTLKKYLDGTEDYRIYDSAVTRLENEDKIFGIKYQTQKKADEYGNTRVLVVPYYYRDAASFDWKFTVVGKQGAFYTELQPVSEDEGYSLTVGPEYTKKILRMEAIDKNQEIIYSVDIAL